MTTTDDGCDAHRKEIERERSRYRRAKATDAQGRSVYRTAMWLRRRRQVLFEQPLCALCGERLATEVDHIVPLEEGGAPYDRENLRGLCSPCHWERPR
jgi:5-methylcytosine-specific restriction endonuclease McrA